METACLWTGRFTERRLRRLRALLIYTVALLLGVGSHRAWAIDLLPNDIEAPPPDVTYVSPYYQSDQYNNFSVNGQKVVSNPSLDYQVGGIRLARSYALGDYPGVTYAQIGAGQSQPGGSISSLNGASGLTDTILATAIWPYANRETRTYFGLAGYVFLPTGSYSNQRAINMGANRYSADLQAGFQTQLTESLAGAVAFDTMWFGANNQFGAGNSQLTQKPLYTSQIGPIYRFNRVFTLGANYLYVVGGDQSINGQAQNLIVQTQRYYVTLLTTLDIGRIALLYGSDLETRNGYWESCRLMVRFTKAF